ncbi:uncharacterized mitochondrial protein AtMg00310-like [Cornus florida]|uniref:uncharacterized mitochondrial protein AtMg00310-like n=1 Tax=Cornus florida TaxID=4283 RepID=UPI0028A19023|nr:uncharacterized mitochondrial protein AtMg00310-like [Cornus florida]
MLSKAGREVLIKATLASIPSYALQCFKLTASVCNKLTSKMSAFWWSRKEDNDKIRWVKWEKLCVHKNDGGLGFKILVAFNIALLAKLGWRLVVGEEYLFYKIYKSKYFPYCDFLKLVVDQEAPGFGEVSQPLKI